MDTLLKHMLDITGHRDQDLIEISILSAISQMLNVKDARILELSRKKERTYLFPVAWLENGKVLISNEVMHNNEESLENYPVLMHCIQHHCRFQEKIDSTLHKLWVPIWSEDEVIACFEIHNHKPFPRKTLDLIDGMLGVYRNFVSLLEYSETDSLTRLLNRKSFEKHFTKARMHATPYLEVPAGLVDRRHDGITAEPVDQWLAVVDIDYFKRINDTFGHLYGDEVLILLAQLMKSSFRAHDRIFRFGGEEFVILIHSVTMAAATHIVERFRKSVENHRFPQVGTITVSIGFTNFHPDESPSEILGHADHALYYAKKHGRNQSQNYQKLVSEGLLKSGVEVEIAPIDFF